MIRSLLPGQRLMPAGPTPARVVPRASGRRERSPDRILALLGIRPAVLTGAFMVGGALALLAGGPAWLSAGYATLGVALGHSATRHGRRDRVRRADVQASTRPACATVTTPSDASEPAASDAPRNEATRPAVRRPAPTPHWPAADLPRAAQRRPAARTLVAWPAASARAADRRHRDTTVVAEREPTRALTALGCWPAVELQRIAQRPPATPARPAASARAADPRCPHPVVAERQPMETTTAIGYVRAGSQEPEIDVDINEAITSCCEAKGLRLARVARDVARPGHAHAQPALSWALDQLATDQAQTLVVARLADLSDSAPALAELLRWLDEQQRTLIAIDLGLDTSTKSGQLTANALVQVGGWEHERLSARTRRGLEAARVRAAAAGPAPDDVGELKQRIRRMRENGMTLQAIADALNHEGVPTLRGGAKWRPSSVQAATGYRRPSSTARRLDLPQPKSAR